MKTTNIITTNRLPSVLVLLATHNGEKWLRQQLDSIFNQLEVKVHVAVSDDNSTDATLEILQEYKNLGYSITILDSSIHQLGSPIRNFFRLVHDVELKDYNYILFSDQDDLWDLTKIKHSIEQITLKSVDCYASNLNSFSASYKNKTVKKNYRQKKYDYLFQGASAGCTYCLTMSAMSCVKKVVAHNYFRFPKDSSHDWLTYAVTRSRGFNWFIDSFESVSYRQHDANSYGANLGFNGLLSKLNMFENRWYRNNINLASKYCKLNSDAAEILYMIKRFNLYDRIKLTFQVFSFRRSAIDCLFLAVLILTKKL